MKDRCALVYVLSASLSILEVVLQCRESYHHYEVQRVIKYYQSIGIGEIGMQLLKKRHFFKNKFTMMTCKRRNVVMMDNEQKKKRGVAL